MSKRRGVLAGTQKIKKQVKHTYIHRGVGNYTRNIENLLRFAHGMFLFVFPCAPDSCSRHFPEPNCQTADLNSQAQRAAIRARKERMSAKQATSGEARRNM